MNNFLTKKQEPYTFMLKAAIAGMLLIFLVLLLIYLWRKGSPAWIAFKLPGVFWFSTFSIVISSLSLNLANSLLKKEKFIGYKWLLGLTVMLGTVFMATQLLGWFTLFRHGISLGNSLSGTFLYVISGLHFLHVLGGLVFLIIAFVEVLKRLTYVDMFVYSINPPTRLRLKLLAIYWHFVDFLWVGLFLFFVYHHG